MRIAAILAALTGVIFIYASSSHTAYAEQAPSNTVVSQGATKTITVQPGDYLSKLATDNNTTIERLFYANTQIEDPNLIYPGEQLQVPSADEQLTPRSMPGYTNAVASSDTDEASGPSISSTAQTAPSTTPQPVVTTAANTSVWDRLAQCESSGNWGIDTGNGYYGGLQFTLSSWRSVGGTGYPNQASRDEQIALAEKLQATQGWGAWPACSTMLGL